MKFYFDNDRSYSKTDEKTPITCNNTPIGYLSKIHNGIVEFLIFDKYIGKEFGESFEGRYLSAINIGCSEQDETAIEFKDSSCL